VMGKVCQSGKLEVRGQTIRGGRGGIFWAGRARTRLCWSRTYKPPKGQRGASPIPSFSLLLFVSLFGFDGCKEHQKLGVWILLPSLVASSCCSVPCSLPLSSQTNVAQVQDILKRLNLS